MELNKNIFCASNPARMADALWHVISHGDTDISDMLIFLPSRRAVRTVEKMIADKMGGAALLPRLVALGEGTDDEYADNDYGCGDDVVPDILRVCVAAKLLAADANIGSVGAALPVARDLIRMTDYLENEGINVADMDWSSVVDDKYAAHFQAKAQMLNIIARVMPLCGGGRQTATARRNSDIRAWIDVIRRHNFSRVIVCASTASVPATADLMAQIAQLPHGRIILSGCISGDAADIALDTNPYNSEYKFLSRLGYVPEDVIKIDVGPSAMTFFNTAFGNNVSADVLADISHCTLVECMRESEEAAAAVEIASRAAAVGQSVLIITPDAAANQRLRALFAARGITADFSGGISGTMTAAGRAILNLLDDWIERADNSFEHAYAAASGNLLRMISNLIEAAPDAMRPVFDLSDDEAGPVWTALADLSAALDAAGIVLSASDARAFVADSLAGVSVRPQMQADARICVLGTIESRMQTADVVILTGLNEGMFPARGYENAWLPRAVARRVGLPSADRKVSLMALDFMNLSCGKRVYWLRSKMSGGTQTTESRFLSRVMAHRGLFDTCAASDILNAVRERDMPPARPLNFGVAAPGADWSDVYVTELELLIHNPYAFYARHILRLYPMDDWWAGPDARTFGNLVHGVIENATDFTPASLIAQMDARARQEVGEHSVLYHFWHRRFEEIAPIVADVFGKNPGRAEIAGSVRVPVGSGGARTVRARADRVCGDVVVDIKTGAAPSKKQLCDGTMPQLPLEAHMLRSGGFGAAARTDSPQMMFLQLRGGDVRAISYNAAETKEMIDAALDKVTELFNQYTAGAATYEYRLQNEIKYRAYDDLARVDD